MGRKLNLLALTTLLACNTWVAAQDANLSQPLLLFEGLDGSNNSAANSASRNTNSGRGVSRAAQAEPTFTLVGTSRIGSDRKALLRHISGEVIQVPLTDGINAVPGYELYAVVNHRAGQVALRYPAALPCGDYPDRGVSCDATTNISSLSITTADAIAPIEPAPAAGVEPLTGNEGSGNSRNSENNEDNPTEQPEAVRNPFAAIRDRGRIGPTQAAPASQFQVRRILPEDVPPGKRVVSTPFGDRLVDI